MRFSGLFVLLALSSSVHHLYAAEGNEQLQQQFGEVQMVVKKYCVHCHSAAKQEGELDLEQFSTVAAVRNDLSVWRKVVEMLDDGEMPPEGEPQPNNVQKKQLAEWAQAVIQAEILARAGDPGRVVLRRLNHAEYTYTVQDLTGVRLNPAREFPVDGAAGEGFINAGEALAMSPALVQKYLDASKEIASHAVLLPDGFRFSASHTQRDWSNEILTQIRLIYARHTSGETDASILNRWNADPSQSTAHDGRIDLARYFTAIIGHREALRTNPSQLLEIAKQEKLNAKYLSTIALVSALPANRSPLLESITQRLKTAKVDEAAALAADVQAWQNVLWKFQPVGSLGLIQRWQQPVNPLPDAVTLRHPLAAEETRPDYTAHLIITEAGDGPEDDRVVLYRPRIEFKDRPPILLRDVRTLSLKIERTVAAELGRADQYLAALAERQTSSQTLEQLAAKRKLDAALLAQWSQFVGLSVENKPTVTGHFTKKLSNVAGHKAVNGWATADLPALFTNRSGQAIRFSTLTIPPRGVTVHPSVEQEVVVAWQSPIDGEIRMSGKVADADDKCGNGAAWRVEMQNRSATSLLAAGEIDNGREQTFEPQATYSVRRGDILWLAVNARQKDHVCDTTHIEWKLSEVAGKKQVWNLSTDVVDDIHAGNPHADLYNNAAVWHFLARTPSPAAKAVVPPGSTLARWQAAVLDGRPQAELDQTAAAVRQTLVSAAEVKEEPDQALRRQLFDWNGPLNWMALAKDAKIEVSEAELVDKNAYGLNPADFGKHPQGSSVDETSLVVQAPYVLSLRLPAALVRGGELVVEAALDRQEESVGSVQVQWAKAAPQDAAKLLPGVPILTQAGSPARLRVTQDYDVFREIFPAAMCHARIVPVDATVTLVLFHREDDHLMRLMLDEAEAARLNRLWDELRFVSQDALRMEVALEQILEFASQDSDPKVFDPVRAPIAQNAAVYRRQLVEVEGVQLQSMWQFAGRAFRRPLSEAEQQRLTNLYESLRRSELPHDTAFRFVLARVLSSPAFLFRLEKPGESAEAEPISGVELASRLSYFLWSSMPDEELLQLARQGKLTQADVLKTQTARMLKDERCRRLAVEFACQWLHLRDFDQLDEKSERHFPEFVGLRHDMYEETIRFFEDMFRNDGSILDILNADHTFLNESLAKHYGIPHVNGAEWRKVQGVKEYGRGGILMQASSLARQSGASRTSPILRGNWVAETLLGERLPRPPKDVPQLPEDEAGLAGLTVRQLVEKHTSDAACAKCHVRIDPYGFSLERFDAIGRLRDKDLAGNAIDTRTTLKDGRAIEGAEGLRNYLLHTRREAFVKQFCRKLLGFALGRSVQLSDDPLLQEMMQRLEQTDYRFSAAVESIVQSKQFCTIRGNLWRDNE